MGAPAGFGEVSVLPAPGPPSPQWASPSATGSWGTCSLVPGHAAGHRGSSWGWRVLTGSRSGLGRASPPEPSPCLQNGRRGARRAPATTLAWGRCALEAWLGSVCAIHGVCLQGASEPPGGVTWLARGYGELRFAVPWVVAVLMQVNHGGCQLLCVPFVTPFLCRCLPPPAGSQQVQG